VVETGGEGCCSRKESCLQGLAEEKNKYKSSLHTRYAEAVEVSSSYDEKIQNANLGEL